MGRNSPKQGGAGHRGRERNRLLVLGPDRPRRRSPSGHRTCLGAAQPVLSGPRPGPAPWPLPWVRTRQRHRFPLRIVCPWAALYPCPDPEQNHTQYYRAHRRCRIRYIWHPLQADRLRIKERLRTVTHQPPARLNFYRPHQSLERGFAGSFIATLPRLGALPLLLLPPPQAISRRREQHLVLSAHRAPAN